MNSSPRIRVFPAEGFGRFGVQADAAEEFATQVRDRSKDAAVDHLALQFGKPDLDLVQPTKNKSA